MYNMGKREPVDTLARPLFRRVVMDITADADDKLTALAKIAGMSKKAFISKVVMDLPVPKQLKK